MDNDQAEAAGSVVSTKISRRSLLKSGAAALVASGAIAKLAPASAEAHAVAAPRGGQGATRLPKAPNIIVIMTDQERHHVHWPAGWGEKNLPGMQQLKRHGLYFNRAYT